MPYDFNLKTKDNHLIIGEIDANKLVEEYSKEHKAELEKLAIEKESKLVDKKIKNDN